MENSFCMLDPGFQILSFSRAGESYFRSLAGIRQTTRSRANAVGGLFQRYSLEY